MNRSLTGRLLVATPALTDPNFARSVVLVLDHGEEGAVGVVLNRPTRVPVSAALPALDQASASPAVVFVGGPVQPDGIVALTRSVGAAVQPIVPGVGVLDLDAGEELEPAGLRLFAGYAGWGPAQLEGEVDEGSWFVVDAAADDAFTDEPEGLWRRVLVRQGGLFSTAVEDPSRN
jgi:putative transcriptional regulator